MGMRKIKKGDTVMVTAGKDKGRTGVVLHVLAPQGTHADCRLLVEGINMVKKHVKPNPAQEKPGGIVEKEASIHISNVAILNTMTNQADRVSFKTLEDGRKVRVYKSSGEEIGA